MSFRGYPYLHHRFSEQRRDLTGDAEQTSQWPIGGFRFVMGVPP